MNIALILSGGTGTRLGSQVPKQYVEAAGRPVISYCIHQLSLHPAVDVIQIVADLPWRERIEKWLETEDAKNKFHGFSDPGQNRQLSILHALEDIRGYADDNDYVFIHDAARPLLSARQIAECLEGVIGHDALVPVLPMKDTVYSSADGKSITSLLNRSEIFAGQAPEVFRLGKYYEANRQLLPERILKINGSAEPAIMAGMEVFLIPGDEGNFKITTRGDLERFLKIAADEERQDIR